ncbi:hypothetical protein GF337_04420 [candidate division KSB1 bacterium]|nr:hypothetical protein [candidate division KSB1 bacterium]
MAKTLSKHNDHYLSLIAIVFFITFLCKLFLLKEKNNANEKVVVRIDIQSRQQKQSIEKFLPAGIDLDNKKYLEASVNWKQFFFLQKIGLNPALQIEVDRNEIIDPQFHTFTQFDYLVRSLKRDYPAIVHIEQIGTGSVEGLPIWGIKISDNPTVNENEPAILLTAVHHAQEPLGLELCLYLMDYLCSNYEHNKRVTKWIEEVEIWFVPVINPDGFYLIMDGSKSLHFWRKNLRDNNLNSVFDPETDGIDLNRNYDYNWHKEGDPNCESWHYRGPFPFSEKETQAIRNLTLRENFVFNLDFHSHGEVILYPWDNELPPADIDFVKKLANQIAVQIQKKDGPKSYEIRPLNGNLGQCSVWMHGKAGVQSFTVEMGDSHLPAGRDISRIILENANGAFFVLDRLFQGAIKGTVRNGYTSKPIRAEIVIEKYASPHIANPVSDSQSGFYYRVMEPGKHTIRFRSPGYRTKIYRAVKITHDDVLTLDVELYPFQHGYSTEN